MMRLAMTCLLLAAIGGSSAAQTDLPAGALVPCGDVDALVEAVIAGTTDLGAHAAMADAARARAEALFSMNLAVERYEIYFRHVLACRGGTSL